MKKIVSVVLAAAVFLATASALAREKPLRVLTSFLPVYLRMPPRETGKSSAERGFLCKEVGVRRA